MSTATLLEPLAPQRAQELREMFTEATRNDKAVALDERGFAIGVVEADDQTREHILGDLDVHA